MTEFIMVLADSEVPEALDCGRGILATIHGLGPRASEVLECVVDNMVDNTES